MKRVIFSISKIYQFPNKSAVFALAEFSVVLIIPNLYGAIMNFRGFFGSDPLPTPEK
jgi:hypothetical protein